MSLKGFHIFFISISTLLVLGLAAWCIQAQALLSGGICFFAAAALIVYGIYFLRKMRNLKIT
jgi:hypothetical protein